MGPTKGTYIQFGILPLHYIIFSEHAGDNVDDDM
jgi:hypothetical protein